MFRRKNDILLKSAFQETFPELLQFYIPDAYDIFDMAKGFEFLDKELQEIMPEVEMPGGTRFADLLVKAWLQNGTEEWILVHIEIQGTNDALFARRMFTYYYRVLDKFNVPITAFAVFTGEKAQQQPAVFTRNFLGTELTYRYNTYHILNHSEAELLAMGNAFALFILAAQKALLAGKIPEEELAEHRWTVAKAFIESRKYSHERIQHFLNFLKNFIYTGNAEINANFDRRLNTLTGNTSTMNITETILYIAKEEGKEEGKEEKEETVVINLIIKLGLSDEQAAIGAGTSIEYVQEIRRKLERNQ